MASKSFCQAPADSVVSDCSSNPKFSSKPTSTFVMLITNEETINKLYEIKVDRSGRITGGSFVAGFFDKATSKTYNIPSLFDLGGVCICNKLYMLISCSFNPYHGVLSGFVFDLKTRKLDKFKHPRANKEFGIVIYADKKIHFLREPSCMPPESKHSFEQYDPITDTWESLMPFPLSYVMKGRAAIPWVTGHAVWNGYILLSYACHKPCSVISYDIDLNCWKHVCVGDDISWSGSALVLDNNVYAPSVEFGNVITFSISIDTTEEGHGFITLSKPSVLPGLTIKHDLDSSYDSCTQSLTHLGDRLFCLFQTHHNYQRNGKQGLDITTFLVEGGNNIKVLDTCTLYVKGYDLDVAFSFTGDMGEMAQIEENTTLMHKQKQDHDTDADQDNTHRRSETNSCTWWSSWTMNQAMAVGCYGVIPFVIFLGFKYYKPASAVISRLLKHD